MDPGNNDEKSPTPLRFHFLISVKCCFLSGNVYVSIFSFLVQSKYVGTGHSDTTKL